jgi:invasion protein IalB
MKLNSKLQLTAFFMSILMLTACGGGDSATPQLTPQVTTPVTPPSQSLKGSWSTQCQASKALDGYDEQDTLHHRR